MDRCVACGFRSAGRLELMHVEGHTYGFCKHHARQLGPDTPSTTYDLAERLGRIALDRRGDHDRRRQQDRRWFPPRPEGRRHDGGRRADDPQLA